MSTTKITIEVDFDTDADDTEIIVGITKPIHVPNYAKWNKERGAWIWKSTFDGTDWEVTPIISYSRVS